MGILDDAIREHLELKRQHGAAEEELRQQEVEALGTPGDAGSEDAAELADGNGGQAISDESLEAEAAPEAEAVPEPELQEPEPAEPEPPPLQPTEPFEPDFQDLDSDEPEATFPPVEEEPLPGGDTPVSGFAAVDEEEEEEGEVADEGDVLEDTPDFLQETPEHDRLWFEQKPPRDFDFD
jgi:hypothetical protein